jgi:hypothetical protein
VGQYLSMGRLRYPHLMLWLCVIAVILGLSETFGRQTREEREQEQLASLQESAETAGESLTYSMPVVVPENELFLFDFDRVKRELDLLGYDCVEVNRGMDTELFDAGVAKVRALDHEPTEMIVARFDRRR